MLKEMKKMFTQVNEDCKETNEVVVPFSDVSFYADQIQNIYDFTYEQSLQYAQELQYA